MCCWLAALMLFGARAAVLVWWLIDPFRFRVAFSAWMIPVLGFFFLPWTTLAYLLVWSPEMGLVGFDWVWITLALIVDVGSYGGGAASRRRRQQER